MSDYTITPPDAPLTPDQLGSIRDYARTPGHHFTASVALALLDEIDRLRAVLEDDAENEVAVDHSYITAATNAASREVGDLFGDWTTDEDHAQ